MRYSGDSEKVLISKFGSCHSHSDVFYNLTDDCFYEDVYLYGAVDDGDEKFFGSKKLSDVDLWKRLIEDADNKGIEAYLKIRKNPPNIDIFDDGISLNDFINELEELHNKYKYIFVTDISVENESVCVKISGTDYIFTVEKSEFFYLLKVKIKFTHSYGYFTFESALKGLREKIGYRIICLEDDRMREKDRLERKTLHESSYKPMSEKKKSYGLLIAVMLMYALVFFVYPVNLFTKAVAICLSIVSVVLIIKKVFEIRKKE